MIDHPQDLSLRRQTTYLVSGRLDAGDLLSATFERMTARDEALNSLISTFPEEAKGMLAHAHRALGGVPVVIKDQFSLPWRAPTNGLPRAPARYKPGASAVFQSLRDGGAVIAGVTNMHQLGFGSTGIISAFGPCRNPHDTARCAGGSSGGSAAAVAARLTAGAVGTDGAGSIRIPAAYCGVVGLKPTFNTVDTHGCTSSFSSVAAIGPLARDVRDCRLLAEILLRRKLPERRGTIVVGVVDWFWTDLDPRVEDVCRSALELADSNDFQIAKAHLEGAELSLVAGIVRLGADLLSEVDREVLEDWDLHPVVRGMLMAQAIRPASILLRADRVRSLLRRSVVHAFGDCDVLVWPTVPAPAPPIDDPHVDLPSGRVHSDMATVRQAALANLTGVPAISVPCGSVDGMPVGLMVHAPWGREGLALEAAERVESVVGQAASPSFDP